MTLSCNLQCPATSAISKVQIIWFYNVLSARIDDTTWWWYDTTYNDTFNRWYIQTCPSRITKVLHQLLAASRPPLMVGAPPSTHLQSSDLAPPCPPFPGIDAPDAPLGSVQDSAGKNGGQGFPNIHFVIFVWGEMWLQTANFGYLWDFRSRRCHAFYWCSHVQPHHQLPWNPSLISAWAAHRESMGVRTPILTLTILTSRTD